METALSASRFFRQILYHHLTSEAIFDTPQGKQSENRSAVLFVRRAV